MEPRPFIHTFERLGEILREARALKQLTVNEVAALAETTELVVTELEAGRPRAEIPATVRILSVLGVEARSIPTYPQWAFDESGAIRQDVEPPTTRKDTEDESFI
ncbi:MAG TPA: helix-turn-helix domain-containing protein [Candidatus Lumbricidophila sp.]|nr:helix-turn-helix domain-containing protein [Candidatus Lumbricidophila sp.]